MRWPWRRPHKSDRAQAQAAQAEAQAQMAEAKSQTPKVVDAERVARELARRSDALARDVQRALRMRGHA